MQEITPLPLISACATSETLFTAMDAPCCSSWRFHEPVSSVASTFLFPQSKFSKSTLCCSCEIYPFQKTALHKSSNRARKLRHRYELINTSIKKKIWQRKKKKKMSRKSDIVKSFWLKRRLPFYKIDKYRKWASTPVQNKNILMSCLVENSIKIHSKEKGILCTEC